MTWALLFQSNLPNFFWFYALFMVLSYLSNLPNIAKICHHIKNFVKSYIMLLSFGCLGAFITLAHLVFIGRSWILEFYLCVVGDQVSQIGYIVYNLHTWTTKVSKNVSFYTQYFPFFTINIIDPTTLAHISMTTQPTSFFFLY